MALIAGLGRRKSDRWSWQRSLPSRSGGVVKNQSIFGRRRAVLNQPLLVAKVRAPPAPAHASHSEMTDANRHRVLRGKLSGKNQSHGKKQLADSENPHWESVLLAQTKTKAASRRFFTGAPGRPKFPSRSGSGRDTGEPCIDPPAAVIGEQRRAGNAGRRRWCGAPVPQRGRIETAAILEMNSDDVAAL